MIEVETFEILEQEIQDNLPKLCPDCGEELYAYDLGYRCLRCRARFGVSRWGDLYRDYGTPFRPAD